MVRKSPMLKRMSWKMTCNPRYPIVFHPFLVARCLLAMPLQASPLLLLRTSTLARLLPLLGTLLRATLSPLSHTFAEAISYTPVICNNLPGGRIDKPRFLLSAKFSTVIPYIALHYALQKLKNDRMLLLTKVMSLRSWLPFLIFFRFPNFFSP